MSHRVLFKLRFVVGDFFHLIRNRKNRIGDGNDHGQPYTLTAPQLLETHVYTPDHFLHDLLWIIEFPL